MTEKPYIVGVPGVHCTIPGCEAVALILDNKEPYCAVHALDRIKEKEKVH